MWHELPRKYVKPGSFPGAPMHPHRGFCELPYCKEMSGGNSDEYGKMIVKDHTGETCLVSDGEAAPRACPAVSVSLSLPLRLSISFYLFCLLSSRELFSTHHMLEAK